MCGRYYIAEDDAAEELRQIIEAVNRRNPNAKTSGEIRPGDTVPVLANSPIFQPGAYAMHWGNKLPDGKLLYSTPAAKLPRRRQSSKTAWPSAAA